MHRSSATAITCLLALAITSCTGAVANVQVGPPVPAQIPLALPAPPEPTPLEAFASRPSAIVTWASPVGRLESSNSRAILTAH